MAKFEGSFEDFEKFIGPATSKMVTKLGKELKKSQKSCQNHVLKNHTPHSEPCGKYKNLDAAHFSHKKLDRKSIIRTILNEHFAKGDLYSVDLNRFLNYYEKAHTPLEDSLIMLCRQHHVPYDKFNNSLEAEESALDDIDKVISISTVEEQDLSFTINHIKVKLKNELTYLKEAKCNIAKISGNDLFFWNFNIRKKNSTGFLLCLNQFDRSVTVLKYDFTSLVVGTLKKDKEHLSLVIPYSEIEFEDKETGYRYEVVESIKLQ